MSVNCGLRYRAQIISEVEPFVMYCVVSNAGQSLAPCPLSLQGLLTVHCSCWNYSSAELMLCVLSSIPGAWCALSRDLSWAMDRRGGRGGWKLVTQRVRSAFLVFCTLNVLPPKDLGDLFDSGQKHYIFSLILRHPLMYIFVKYAV